MVYSAASANPRLRPVPAAHPALANCRAVIEEAVARKAPAVRADPTFYGEEGAGTGMRALAGACGDAGIPLMMTVRLEDIRQRHPHDRAPELAPHTVRTLIRSHPRLRILVTHAMLAPVRMSISQMQQAARQGAMIEFVYNALIGSSKMFEPSDYAKAIRAVGIDHCVLSSDLGQAGNPLHPDGFEAFLKAMAALGFSSAELDRMSKKNPGAILGLQ